jgi:hypothetical protein
MASPKAKFTSWFHEIGMKIEDFGEIGEKGC